jgi:hypothetical protein
MGTPLTLQDSVRVGTKIKNTAKTCGKRTVRCRSTVQVQTGEDQCCCFKEWGRVTDPGAEVGKDGRAWIALS